MRQHVVLAVGFSALLAVALIDGGIEATPEQGMQFAQAKDKTKAKTKTAPVMACGKAKIWNPETKSCR